MRFDFAALWQVLSALPRLAAGLAGAMRASTRLMSAKTGASMAGALLAAATVVYVVWPKPEELPVDAVVTTAAPVFTPATWKPAVPSPAAAAAPSPSYDGEPGRATDMRDPVSVTRAVQRRLRAAGCYDGRINGAWNAATRRAMAAFTEIVNARLPVDRADPVLLVLLETHESVTCSAPMPASLGRGARQETASTGARESERGAPETAEREIREREIVAPAPQPAERGSRSEEMAEVEDDIESSSALPVEGAAAVAAAAATANKVARTDPPRAKRKYRRKPSLSRSFRQIQRSMKAIFF